MKWLFPFDILRFLVRYSIFAISLLVLSASQEGEEIPQNRLSLMHMHRHPRDGRVFSVWVIRNRFPTGFAQRVWPGI